MRLSLLPSGFIEHILHMIWIFIRLLIIIYNTVKFKREVVNECLSVI